MCLRRDEHDGKHTTSYNGYAYGWEVVDDEPDTVEIFHSEYQGRKSTRVHFREQETTVMQAVEPHGRLWKLMHRKPMSGVAYAGYLTAMLLPLIGFFFGVFLLGRRERHGWGVIAMAAFMVFFWFVIAILAFVPDTGATVGR